MSEIKIRNLKSKLETYEKSLEYLTQWCQDNQEVGKKITKWLNDNSEKFEMKNLKTITNYHIEISKINYATIALLDKVYKQKERLEKWEKEIERVQ